MNRTFFGWVMIGMTVCAARAQDCEALAKLKLPETEVTVAQVVSSGSFTPKDGKAISGLPPFCRVAAISKPAADSEIEFEVWLPIANWNRKFQGVGNGGFAGAIEYQQMGQVIARGYATASTNTGHNDNGVDASWALNHPQKIIDFGYRAIHNTAANAKEIIRAFYGSAAKRSYFDSCSNGGRQALMEAERYPGDYDGIIAGAPASYWTHLLANAAWDSQALLGQPASYIPAAKLPAIQAAALGACDAQDGVKDGVIEDPPGCHFDTKVLLCTGSESDACLTAPQLTALNALYAGGHTASGKAIFPGYSAGGEAEPGGWGLWIVGPAPRTSLMYMFGTQFFKNMVFNDANWDLGSFKADRDMAMADQKRAGDLNANDPDLHRFQEHGGKLILYHGWADAAIAPTATIDYYQRVTAKLTVARTREFVRLFMVPGMEHCGGGTAPNDFGQMSLGAGDDKHSMETQLERWVDGGTGPNLVIAAKHDSDGKVTRTRPLCAYPAVAHYKGSGSTDDAANFVCASAKLK